MKSYDHLSFWLASVDQFRASRYIMRLNRTSEWKFMTIRSSRELPLSNFERLDILSLRTGHPREELWPVEFARAYVAQFRASRYVMRLSRKFESKVMLVWISKELLLYNFEGQDILCALIIHPSEKLWPFEFLESFRCSISTISIYYAPDSNLWVKNYDHFNFARASGVQFRASRYIISPNQIFQLNVILCALIGLLR